MKEGRKRVSKYKNITMDLGFGSMEIEFNPPVEIIPRINCNIKLEMNNGNIVFRGLNINSNTIDLTKPFEVPTIMPTFAKDQSYISELDRKVLKQSWLGTWLTANNYTVKLIELVDDVYFAGFVLLENGKIEADRPVHYNKQGNPYNFDTEQYGKLMRRLDTEASYAESINKHT